MTLDITDEQFDASMNLGEAMKQYVDAYGIKTQYELGLKYDPILRKIGLAGVTIVIGKKETKIMPKEVPK